MPEPLDPRRRAALGLKGRGSKPPDPRHIVTPDAFEVDASLLGIPLAPHGRRLAAIGVDGILVAVLTQAGGLLLGILAALFFLRLALPGRRGAEAQVGAGGTEGSLADGPGRRDGARIPGVGLFRGALGCMGAVILLITVLTAWGALSSGSRGPAPSWEDALPPTSGWPMPGMEGVPGMGPAPGGGTEGAPETGGAAAPDTGSGALPDTGTAAVPDGDTSAATAPTVMPGIPGATPQATPPAEERRFGGVRGWLRTLAEDLGLGFGWGALYFSAFLAWGKGQTPGKRLLRLRVVRLDRKPITLWVAFERYGGYAAGFATGLLGFAQVFWDANRQAIHDRISGTVVIRDGAKPLPEPTRRLRTREPLHHEPRAEP
jgi:hypothetical protein